MPAVDTRVTAVVVGVHRFPRGQVARNAETAAFDQTWRADVPSADDVLKMGRLVGQSQCPSAEDANPATGGNPGRPVTTEGHVADFVVRQPAAAMPK